MKHTHLYKIEKKIQVLYDPVSSTHTIPFFPSSSQVIFVCVCVFLRIVDFFICSRVVPSFRFELGDDETACERFPSFRRRRKRRKKKPGSKEQTNERSPPPKQVLLLLLLLVFLRFFFVFRSIRRCTISSDIRYDISFVLFVRLILT